MHSVWGIHTFLSLCSGLGQITKLDYQFETLVDDKWGVRTVRKYCRNLSLVWRALWLDINMLDLTFFKNVFSVYFSCFWLLSFFIIILICCWLQLSFGPNICSLKLWFGGTDSIFNLSLLHVVCFPIRFCLFVFFFYIGGQTLLIQSIKNEYLCAFCVLCRTSKTVPKWRKLLRNMRNLRRRRRLRKR